MDISNYGTSYGKKSRVKRHRITGIIVIFLILFIGISVVGILTSDGPEYKMRASTIEENHILKEQIAELTEENERLKSELQQKEDYITTLPTQEPTQDDADVTDAPSSPRE